MRYSLYVPEKIQQTTIGQLSDILICSTANTYRDEHHISFLMLIDHTPRSKQNQFCKVTFHLEATNDPLPTCSVINETLC